jgi:hypothetical protein
LDRHEQKARKVYEAANKEPDKGRDRGRDDTPRG